MATIDARGHLALFAILSGQALDPAGLPLLLLLEGHPFEALVGHRTFDADWLVQSVEARDGVAAVRSKTDRKEPRDHCRVMHVRHRQVDFFFMKNKYFREVATRHDKTDESCWALIHSAAGVIAAR